MAQMELTLANLKDLDFGKVDVAFRRHMERAVKDCLDRPGDDTTREVRLTFRLEPEKTQGGEPSHVMLECDVQSNVPPHRSATFQCRPTVKGQLVFQSIDAECVDQQSLDELDGNGR